MNWLIRSNRNTSPLRPANVLVIALMTSTLDVIVLAPMPKQTPATRNSIVMMKIRLSISGESLKIEPVTGLRNGASGNTVSSTTPRKARGRTDRGPAQPAWLTGGDLLVGVVDLAALGEVVRPEAPVR